MMKGYNREDAYAFIMSHLNRSLHKELSSQLETLISEAIDADMLYMEKAGVIDAEGNGGNAYYDDDDAFEFILDEIVTKHKFDADTAMKVASVLDDYMEFQEQYMDKAGLVGWD